MSDVIFRDARVPAANVIGSPSSGSRIFSRIMFWERALILAPFLGAMQRQIEDCVRYANERVQFGKPISSFQAIQFMIADMATQIEAARALVYEVVDQIMTKNPDSERLSAIAKIFASDVAMKVTTDAVQILGGYGYMKDYPLERMMRDSKVTQIYEGANQVQRLVVAQELFK